MLFTKSSQLHVAFTADQLSTIKVVNWETQREFGVLKPKTQNSRGYGMCMCLAEKRSHTDTDFILAGYEDGSLALWNIASQEMSHRLELFSETMMALDYHSDTNRGVSTSVACDVIVWTVNNSEIQKLSTISLQNPGAGCVRFRADGKLFAVGCWDARAKVFSSRKHNLLAVLTFHSESVQSLAFSSNDSLALGSKDGAVTVWNLYN